MNWKFWMRKKSIEGLANVDGRLPGPKSLPQQIGGYLVIHEKLDPDWVWSLKCVVRPYPKRKTQYDFRVYDPGQAKMAGIKVTDFRSLDHHADHILFQGYYNKYVPEAHFDHKEAVDSAA